MAELYFYASYQAQIKDPFKWRVVRVWNGQHRTLWRKRTKEQADEFIAMLVQTGKKANNDINC